MHSPLAQYENLFMFYQVLDDKLCFKAKNLGLNKNEYYQSKEPIRMNNSTNIYSGHELLKLYNENKLDIEITLNNAKAKYIVKGNKNLNNNSIILIKVTAEDGSIKEYKIKIKKTISSQDSSINKEENIKEEIDDYKDNTKENSNNLLDKISIIPIIVFIVLILFILKMIKRKQQT